MIMLGEGDKVMKKIFFMLGIILTAILLIACGNSDSNVMDKVNPKVTFEPVSNSFYYDQLNEEEVPLFEEIMEMCQTYKGGLIELEEPISANSWLRIIYTLNFDQEKHFWPLVMIYPFDKDGRIVNEPSDEKTVTKLYVHLNEAIENNSYEAFHLKESEDGVLLNEEEFINILEGTTLTEEYYLETSKKIEEMEQEIIAGLPENIRQKDAVFYFCNWIKDNMEYDFDVVSMQTEGEDDTLLFSNAYANASYEQCILQKKALCGGFATVLSDLCNQIGIPSYVVIGIVDVNGETIQHGWVAVEIGGQTLYIDPTFVSSTKRMDALSQKEQMESRRSDGRCYIFSDCFEY